MAIGDLEGQAKIDYEKLDKYRRTMIPSGWDKIDLKSVFDSTLAYSENKKAVREQIRLLMSQNQINENPKLLKEQAEVAKAQQERLDQERKEEAEREADNYNKRIYQDSKDVDSYYSAITRGVNKMSQGFSHLLFVKGRGGIGKSYQIRKALIQNKADFKEISGDVTEAYLYRLIFENNGKILWYKDVVKLLQGCQSINLIKAATETESERLLTKSNYSKEQDDLPDQFLCRCKFIFDYNSLQGNGLKADFEALVTRGDYIEMPFSELEVQGLMRHIAKEDWQKEVTEYIINNFNSNGLIRMNLRTQWKAFRTYNYALKNKLDWKDELKQEMANVSRVRGMLYSLIGKKAVKTTELKKLLLRHEIVGTLRTADSKINDWMYTEELFKVGTGDRDFLVCINDIKDQMKEAFQNGGMMV